MRRRRNLYICRRPVLYVVCRKCCRTVYQRSLSVPDELVKVKIQSTNVGGASSLAGVRARVSRAGRLLLLTAVW